MSSTAFSVATRLVGFMGLLLPGLSFAEITIRWGHQDTIEVRFFEQSIQNRNRVMLSISSLGGGKRARVITPELKSELVLKLQDSIKESRETIAESILPCETRIEVFNTDGPSKQMKRAAYCLDDSHQNSHSRFNQWIIDIQTLF